MCQRPDRDVGGLVCGHPIPCPHHTFVIEGGSVTIPASADMCAVPRLRQIAKSLNPGVPS